MSNGLRLSDPERLAALARSELMDSEAEEVFDRLTRLASRLLRTPVALMTLVDSERQFVKSGVGGIEGSVPVSQSICQYVVRGERPFVVTDVRKDPRVTDSSAFNAAELISYCGVPLTDADGYTLGSLCVMEGVPRTWSSDDVETLRELAEIAMAELELRITHRRIANREAELGAIVAGAHDAFIGFEPDGTVTQWNPAAERIFGWSRDEMLGGSVLDLVRPGTDRTRAREVLAGEPEVLAPHFETQALHRDGHEVRVEGSVGAVPLGEHRRFVLLVRDLAEREARREIEDRLRVTVEHAPIGVGLIDLRAGPHGSLVSVNPAFGALLPAGDPIDDGLLLSSALHPDDADLLRRELARLAADELARVELEVRCLHPNGRIVWVLLTGAAVPTGHGPPQLAVIHALDISQRKRFEGQLQYLADHDALTSLFNRRRFEEELAEMVSLVDRYEQPSALLLIDLDDFKHVNDSMGHSYGDELIARVGSTIRSSLRETDIVGRIGGDEFAVLLRSVDAHEATRVAEKLLLTVEQNGVVVSEHRRAGVTASIGVAPFAKNSGLDAEALLVDADLAMYRAKEAGRNRIALVDHASDAAPKLAPQRSWLARLRAALDNDRFELYAQPIRPICAVGPERFELLLRLRAEDGELISPGAFLYNAERFDLIQEIDRWVFGQALGLISRHEAAGTPLYVSVNMSGKTLSDSRLVTDLREMLRACPIPRDRLIVEVTETAAIVNIDRAREVARTLRGFGCRFALDDFGAGFASFYYLKHLEFDYLKIDGEFVRSLGRDVTDALVIRSVVDIARGLGAETIAEYVGDEQAVRRLRELGVDYGQGNHLGKPLPIAEILPALTAKVAITP